MKDPATNSTQKKTIMNIVSSGYIPWDSDKAVPETITPPTGDQLELLNALDDIITAELTSLSTSSSLSPAGMEYRQSLTHTYVALIVRTPSISTSIVN